MSFLELPNQKGTEEVNLNVNLLETPDEEQNWDEDLYLQYSRIEVFRNNKQEE